MIIGVDPGPEMSAVVCLVGGVGGRVVNPRYTANEELLNEFRAEKITQKSNGSMLGIEDIEHRGLPVGRDVFETLKWVGRFDEAGRWAFRDVEHVKPGTVRVTLCGTTRAKDRHIRLALLDLWGGERIALGSVKCPLCSGKGWRGRGRPACDECCGSGWEVEPGLLRPIQDSPARKHLWRALGVAVVLAGQS